MGRILHLGMRTPSYRGVEEGPRELQSIESMLISGRGGGSKFGSLSVQSGEHGNVDWNGKNLGMGTCKIPQAMYMRS
jgi:hypothetical protein